MISESVLDKNRVFDRDTEKDAESKKELNKLIKEDIGTPLLPIYNALEYVKEIGEDMKWTAEDYRKIAVDFMNHANSIEKDDNAGFNDYTYEKIIEQKSKEMKYLIIGIYDSHKTNQTNAETIRRLSEEIKDLKEILAEKGEKDASLLKTIEALNDKLSKNHLETLESIKVVHNVASTVKKRLSTLFLENGFDGERRNRIKRDEDGDIIPDTDAIGTTGAQTYRTYLQFYDMREEVMELLDRVTQESRGIVEGINNSTNWTNDRIRDAASKIYKNIEYWGKQGIPGRQGEKSYTPWDKYRIEKDKDVNRGIKRDLGDTGSAYMGPEIFFGARTYESNVFWCVLMLDEYWHKLNPEKFPEYKYFHEMENKERKEKLAKTFMNKYPKTYKKLIKDYNIEKGTKLNYSDSIAAENFERTSPRKKGFR